jgi:predicted signal transduction protein with EAL and GGDEF domain
LFSWQGGESSRVGKVTPLLGAPKRPRPPQDTAIVHAVVAFAKTLDLRVTAEGIETAAQIQQLQALGCDHGQGYYVAKPLQPGSVQPFLDTHQPSSPGTDRKRMAPSASGLQRR